VRQIAAQMMREGAKCANHEIVVITDLSSHAILMLLLAPNQLEVGNSQGVSVLHFSAVGFGLCRYKK
jgi:hypothetical protein